MKPHMHCEVIKKWADGYKIEFRAKPAKGRYGSGSPSPWHPCRQPDWHSSFEYRVAEKQDD